MLFLDKNNINEIGVDWTKTINLMEETVKCLAKQDFSQPLKPYLRYRNMKNRIIAMPAFVGGNINIAGIKWIASFPENIKKGLPRAHSVLILNDVNTGKPVAIINTILLSAIRTASVSGLMLQSFLRTREMDGIKVGIIGFGPIGQYHLKMCIALLGKRISKIYLFDIRQIDNSITKEYDFVEIVANWEDAYIDSDILITCTVSENTYIDKRPKPGSLHMNVSLRDYKTDVYKWFKDSIIVDDWEEVCREKTDIEMMHLEKGLKKEDTKSIVDVIQNNCLEEYSNDVSIMFNPMGMAVFDVALGSFYCKNREY